MLVSHQSLGQNAGLINRFKSPSPSKEPLWQSWNVIIFPIIPPPGYVIVATHNTANVVFPPDIVRCGGDVDQAASVDRKSTRLNSSHVRISYAVFCLKKKTNTSDITTTRGEKI